MLLVKLAPAQTGNRRCANNEFSIPALRMQWGQWLAAQDGVLLTSEAKSGSQPIHNACFDGHLDLVKWLATQDGVSLGVAGAMAGGLYLTWWLMMLFILSLQKQPLAQP